MPAARRPERPGTAGLPASAGLTFNEFNGNVANNANVNFGQGSKTNLVPFDPTEWHELYIVIRDDPAWGLDVDWFGYETEAVFPPGARLPPSIFGFAPADRAVYHPAASGMKFSASALMPTNTLPASGIKVTVNGLDVTSQLVLTDSDTSQSRNVTYNGLQPNKIYTATYIVTDSGGLSTTNDISFDTFVEAQIKAIEAEEYNFAQGQFTDNPPAGGDAGSAGVIGVDFQDTTPSDFSVYRNDAVDGAATTDLARNKYPSSGQTDYQVQNIADGEWCNYTAGFASPPYNAWLRYASTANRQVRLDRVTSNPSQPNQTLQFVGVSARLNASGQVVIEWSAGTLLSADTINGTYSPVAGATSPHVVNPAGTPGKFYRVQVSP